MTMIESMTLSLFSLLLLLWEYKHRLDLFNVEDIGINLEKMDEVSSKNNYT